MSQCGTLSEDKGNHKKGHRSRIPTVWPPFLVLMQVPIPGLLLV